MKKEKEKEKKRKEKKKKQTIFTLTIHSNWRIGNS